MRINKYQSIAIMICICSMLFCACSSGGEKTAMKYYRIEQFSNLTVKQSTLQDVQNIEPELALIVTSFGAVTDFPMENGQYIRIEFVGSEMIVDSIEIVDKQWITH